jgi:hypothetical protein
MLTIAGAPIGLETVDLGHLRNNCAKPEFAGPKQFQTPNVRNRGYFLRVLMR